MSERVILAYSGGLDTSVAISWIGKETGKEVVAVAIDLGQGGEDMEVVRQRAIDCGAVEAVVVDARDEFANEQRVLLDQKRAYETQLGLVWSGFWLKLAGYPKIDLNGIKVVTSTHSNKAFETGVDDGIQLRK